MVCICLERVTKWGYVGKGSKHFGEECSHLVIFCFKIAHGNAQCLLQTLHSEITPSGLKEPYVVPVLNLG